MTRPVLAVLSAVSLLLIVGAALVDPAPWLYVPIAWIFASLAAGAIWAAVAEFVKARRRARIIRIYGPRHPSARGWEQ